MLNEILESRAVKTTVKDVAAEETVDGQGREYTPSFALVKRERMHLFMTSRAPDSAPISCTIVDARFVDKNKLVGGVTANLSSIITPDRFTALPRRLHRHLLTPFDSLQRSGYGGFRDGEVRIPLLQAVLHLVEIGVRLDMEVVE